MKLTKKEVIKMFNEEVKPFIPKRHDGTLDRIWLSEEWSNFTDMLCKDRQITENQYNNWSSPY